MCNINLTERNETEICYLGSVIGVAFEAEEHQDWCDHPSSLHVWNLNRRDFDPGNAYKVLEAPACLTSAAFHPQESGLIAAGGHSGEIHVWNAFSDSDPLLASSGVGSIHGHRDKITSVQWINGSHLDSRYRKTLATLEISTRFAQLDPIFQNFTQHFLHFIHRIGWDFDPMEFGFGQKRSKSDPENDRGSGSFTEKSYPEKNRCWNHVFVRQFER